MDTNLKDREYSELSELVYKTSGILLHQGKRELLKAKMAKRMRSTHISTARDYIKRIHSDPDEFIQFIDAVTTNHTFFFRENKGFEYLLENIIPHYADSRKALKIWSAACSTGEEPYSLAVQLLYRNINFKILATDLANSVLNLAKRGIYHKNKAHNIPRAMLLAYFQRGKGEHIDYIRVKDDVKNRILFQKFNLINNSGPYQKFDIIFCRNVMIYFDSKTSEQVVKNLCHSLRPQGYFLIGQSENLMHINHGLVSVRKIPSVYMKP